jgi:hypothetical protein
MIIIDRELPTLNNVMEMTNTDVEGERRRNTDVQTDDKKLQIRER